MNEPVNVHASNLEYAIQTSATRYDNRTIGGNDT